MEETIKKRFDCTYLCAAKSVAPGDFILNCADRVVWVKTIRRVTDETGKEVGLLFTFRDGSGLFLLPEETITMVVPVVR